MDLTRVDLNLLVAFEALMAERSVTRAAARLRLSQPAASDALRRLRLLFRDELFVRVGSAMQPSPRAMQVAPGVSAALMQLRRTLGEAVPFDPAGAPLSFVLAATDYTAQVIVPELTARLQELAPGTELHVVGYDKDGVGDMLARGEVDVALGVFPDPPLDSVKQTLFEERFMGAARAGHPALSAGPPDLATFVTLSHALVTVRRGDRKGAIDLALEKQGLSRHIALTLPHMMSLPQILAQSDLVCALPERIARRLGHSALALFELPLPIPRWNVEMLWNPLSRMDKAGIWFRETVRSVAQGV